MNCESLDSAGGRPRGAGPFVVCKKNYVNASIPKEKTGELSFFESFILMERLTVLNGIIQETTAHVMSSFDRWHARYKVTSVYTREGLPHTYAGGEQIGRILFDLIKVSGSRANTDAFRISAFRGYEKHIRPDPLPRRTPRTIH